MYLCTHPSLSVSSVIHNCTAMHRHRSLRCMAAEATAAFPDATLPSCRSPADEYSLHILRLCALGHLQQALPALGTIRALHPSAFAAVFHACARGRFLLIGRCLHRRVLSIMPWPPDVFVSNHLLNMYAKCGRPDLARRVFDKMLHRNLVSWTALLSGYAQHGHHDDCFRLLAGMLDHHLPNEFALATTLSSCSGALRIYQGRQVHALASKISLDANVFVGNALIAMYSSCKDQCDDSWTVFRTMPFQNLITWNSMIAGFQQNGQLERSRNLFVEMQRGGFRFDRATLVSVISSCYCLQHCQQFHSIAIKTSYDCEVKVATALVKAYSILGGGADDFYGVFSGIIGHDIVSWTGIMTSFAEQQPEEVIRLFCQLRQKSCRPDRYTFSILIKACAGLATERHCSAVHALIEKYGFADDLVLSNALIHAYARCGNISMAEHVFERMVLRDVVSWNSMIKAYAAHGLGRKALDVFRCMDILPDSATFSGLLTACSHSGLVSDGRNLFKSMLEVYGITPQLDHYACMVDIFGRAGDLQEAECFINQMPMEPDSVVWSALLGACRKHKEDSIAKKAAKRLMELEPKSSVGYVMMSNIYSEKGYLDDASFVRKTMEECGVRKEPGLSWIEIGKHIHKFSVGAWNHPQRKAIYAELIQLRAENIPRRKHPHPFVYLYPNQSFLLTSCSTKLAGGCCCNPEIKMVQSSQALPFCSSSPDRLMERSNSIGAPVRYHLPASNEVGDHVSCSGESCRSCTAVTIAGCIALSCCPCAVVSMLALTLVKLPWVVSRRCLMSLRRRGASLRRRVAHVGDADHKVRDMVVVGREGRSSDMKRNKWNEQQRHGSLPSRIEADDRVWMELYHVGNWGFGRVSFSGIQREWRLGKSNVGGSALATSGDEEVGKQC
ncbi:pentatricopeptide repeat-containing protein [Canna indica]|uniref:Pentatricopeptide repeat-containing protein n=1 Tax=Canna indica TaxID=4628 RepID=A0AAQ3JKN4_9LILI|nr:pentatricopeptide repeat-containing protein [Canna indica]